MKRYGNGTTGLRVDHEEGMGTATVRPDESWESSAVHLPVA